MPLILKNKRYTLSPRKAKDQINLGEISDTLDLPQEDQPVTMVQFKNNMVIVSAAISDSVKATYLNFRWWQKLIFIRYRKFVKNNQSKRLLDNLSAADLTNAFKAVLALEGKKKVQDDREQGSLEDKLQKV